MILTPIYEAEFLGFSYGFRPGRSQHDALDALAYGLKSRSIAWILDADIRAFFDKISHEWLIRFVEHRIADKRIVRLIVKWLKAGVLDDNKRIRTKEGTPQGAVISPLLANIYLHYVHDVWVAVWRKRRATGAMIVVRYADDTVVGFQHKGDAAAFRRDLNERLAKFALELNGEKTRLIAFGRFVAERRKERGERKPDTFDFLGFTHICGLKRNGKGFQLHRKTRRGRKWGAHQTGRRGVETHPAQTNRRTGAVAGQGAARALRLLRGPDQLVVRPRGAPSHKGALVSEPEEAKSARPADDVAADECDRRKVAAEAERDAPVAGATLSRQAPAVGAVCLKRARTDLCGGRLVTAVPTAIATRFGPGARRGPVELRLTMADVGAPG